MPTTVTFRGHPDPVKRAEGTPGQVEYCGILFALNQPVEIAPGALTAPQLGKLRTNHNFIVEESEAAASAPAAAPVEETPVETKAPKPPAKSPPIQSSQDAAPAKLPQTPPAAPAAVVEASAATPSPALGASASAKRPVGLTKAK